MAKNDDMLVRQRHLGKEPIRENLGGVMAVATIPLVIIFGLTMLLVLICGFLHIAFQPTPAYVERVPAAWRWINKKKS